MLIYENLNTEILQIKLMHIEVSMYSTEVVLTYRKNGCEKTSRKWASNQDNDTEES